MGTQGKRYEPVKLAQLRHSRFCLLAFELLLPPTRFSTRFVSASELIAFVDLVWGPGIFISRHLRDSPLGDAKALRKLKHPSY